MSARRSPIDQRPFRSRTEQEHEQSLEKQYRTLGNPELIAAIRQMKTVGPEDRPN